MIILERFMSHTRETEANAPMGTMGELYIDGEFKCYTIEQPWRQNRPFISCVPPGEYNLVPFYSPKYGQTLALENTELDVFVLKDDREFDYQRYVCLFHAANWSHQLQGCIAPGVDITWGEDHGHKRNIMVTSSRSALNEILPYLEGERLLIRGPSKA